jgi:insecticidal toxin complex protein TccC
MQASPLGMHHKTPKVFVFDPRGLVIRSVDYWREVEGASAQARINRTLHNAAGVAVKQWDSRLWRLQQQDPMTPANLTTVHSLAGHPVCTVSVDAGSQISLFGLASQMLQGWDSRGTRREIHYDDLLRPVAVFEHVATQPPQCTERMEYARPDHGNRTLNHYGQLIRQDSPGGTVLFEMFAITGQCTRHVQHFTLAAVAPDWPEPIADRQKWLEPGEGAISTWRYGPSGDVLETVDARQNCQAFAFTVDGRLRQSTLKLAGKTAWQTLVSEIEYNAEGQVVREVAGNGVQTTLKYRPENDLLLERRAHSEHGGLLQHLFYTHDPMGNVLSIEDKALPVRYFNNQRIDPVSRFIYDSLYQLIQAFGWEAGTRSQGPDSVGRTNPAAVSNYHQTCCHDEGGNLVKLTHVGAQNPGRELTAARYSNRCLPWRNGVSPTEAEIAAAFDANGNLLELDQGRFLTWNLRNELQSVCPVERDSGRNDCECYFYDGGGQRVRKVRSLQTNARTVTAEVRYLQCLELRTDNGTGQVLQVITAPASLNTVRVLHWESPPPTGVNDQYRYTLVDHLNSCTLELTDDAQIISQEVFYPYGETAWYAGREVTETDFKTIRYSGKERDATGLYYYGYRYYIPWLQHWLNPDPAGELDGLNLYAMVKNNPLTFIDHLGLMGDIGTYEADVGIRVGAAFKLAAWRAKLNVFDSASGSYKKTDEFKVIEVGDGAKFSMSKQELATRLSQYKHQYRSLFHDLRVSDTQEKEGSKLQNYDLGKEIADLTLSSLKYSEPRETDEEVITHRFFALIKRTSVDTASSTREVYGISELMTSTSLKDGVSTVRVSNIIAHPSTQAGSSHSASGIKNDAASEHPKLRGVGTFLTIKSLAAVVKDGSVKKVRTAALNPRSAAIAKRLGARKIS